MEQREEQTPSVDQSAEDIRQAGHRYVARARAEGRDTLTIVTGDIVRELRVPYRIPSVVSALGSKRFQKENGITLEHREGPPSGVSASTRFTYRLNEAISAEATKPSSLWALRGAGKAVFKAVGGGQAFLTEERSQLNLP